MAQAAVNILAKLILTLFPHSAAEQPLLTAHLTGFRETQTPALQRTRFEDFSRVLGPERAALLLLFSPSVFSSQVPRLPSPFLGCHGHWGAQSWALHGESWVLLHSLGHREGKRQSSSIRFHSIVPLAELTRPERDRSRAVLQSCGGTWLSSRCSRGRGSSTWAWLFHGTLGRGTKVGHILHCLGKSQEVFPET